MCQQCGQQHLHLSFICALLFLEWVVRHRLLEQPALRTHLDKVSSFVLDILTESWRITKCSSHTDRLYAFFVKHEQHLQMIFCPASLTGAFAHLDRPHEASAHIYSLVSRNALGKSMFGDCLQAVLSNKVTTKIQEIVLDNIAGKHLTAYLWREVARVSLEAAAAEELRSQLFTPPPPPPHIQHLHLKSTP